ncbi:AAEL000316-PA [Aedes aegypti]|uniref:Uncharacterized protein n=2 Tax=Aedes aegypti TaxID=7159 RepID=Q17PG1_AEDAE|nr:uncharacterized protein LOC5575171 [Aedes aegypti]EAT48656.1 AAEL000316-PA [Aedes aegypti]
MNVVSLLGIISCVFSVTSAVPFSGWLLGGRQNEETTEARPNFMNKVQQLGERVYERKREFLNGINEKVSNILWIPPLYTTTETSIPPSEPPYVFQSDPQKYTEMDSDEDDVQNVEIYARSSFLSPDDLVNIDAPPEPQNKPTITYNINKNFNILGRIWA